MRVGARPFRNWLAALHRPGAVLSNLVQGLCAWYRWRQALHELLELRHADPRLLREIGPDHADLWQAARHGRIARVTHRPL